VAKFIEDNWGLGRLGNGSFDKLAGTLTNMLNFHQFPDTRPVILDPTTDAVVSKH
jgi:phospholipase C